MTRNRNLILLLIVLLKGLDSSSYVTNPISILLHTLNSTLYFVNSELKMTEELSTRVFKVSFTFLNSFIDGPQPNKNLKYVCSCMVTFTDGECFPLDQQRCTGFHC